jgi:electron transport complex protein RnfG
MAHELLADKKDLLLPGQKEAVVIFVLKKNGKPYAVAFEESGKGYAGDVKVMVGFDLATGDLAGIGIGSLSETPGVGTRVKEESFTLQFKGMSKNSTFKLKKDKGAIDGVTGATRSSRAVAAAVEKAKAFYEEHEKEIKALVGP